MLKCLGVRRQDVCNLLSNGSEKVCVFINREKKQMRQNVKQANIAEMGIYFLFTFYHNLNIFKVKMFGEICTLPILSYNFTHKF